MEVILVPFFGGLIGLGAGLTVACGWHAVLLLTGGAGAPSYA